MISKEEFTKLINWHDEQNARLNELNKIFPDCYSADIFDSPFKLLDTIFRICFDEEGVEWISWWMYDTYNYTTKKYDRSYKEDGKEINVETLDDLWKLVKGCRK